MITLKNEQSVAMDTDALKKDAQKIVTFLGYPDFDLGILLADSTHMHKLNKQYRDKDKPTDILSFPYYPDLQPEQRIEAKTPEGRNLGDIIICPAYVKEDLARWDQTFEKRMQTLLIHGICHLLGYDHITDNDYDSMHQKEAGILYFLESNR